MVEAALEKVKGAQSGQAGSNNPTAAPAEAEKKQYP